MVQILVFLKCKKRKKKIVKVLAIYEEIVELVKNKFVGRGIVYPAKKINNRLRKISTISQKKKNHK